MCPADFDRGTDDGDQRGEAEVGAARADAGQGEERIEPCESLAGSTLKVAIVCGGRDYDDAHRLYAELDDLSPTMIIHGGADGADSLAGKWAARRKVPSMCWPADWPTHGKAAGFIRNRQMAEFLGIMRLLGNQTLVVAFPGGRGTAHMVETAESMEFKVWQIDDE